MTTSRFEWLLPAAVLSAPLQAFAVEYLNLEQVQKVMFPSAAEFRPRPALLTEAQRDAIAKASSTRVRSAELELWEAHGDGALLGFVIVDEVYGKHEFITYAVALLPDGSVKQIEIMDYRETYGGQVREPAWRAQFVGKTARDSLAIDKDIRNISGATLSSVHVTEGVRRVLATYDVAVKPKA